MSIKFENFNPDCFVDAGEVRELYHELNKSNALEFFGGEHASFVPIQVIYGSLINYCGQKYHAMRCRERGEIAEAQRYEQRCDQMYKSLPE
jgi:hypothetical protein